MPYRALGDEIEDPRLTDELRLKARKLAQERIAEARGRVVREAQRMTPKKAAKLTAEGISKATEAARQRAAWRERMAETPNPSFNRPAVQADQNTYYAENSPVDAARFTPKRGYVELPFSLKEGVRQDLVEKYGIPDNQADALASNAVDRWAQLVYPANTASAPEPMIQSDYQPKFLVHPFSDVSYPDEDMAQTMGDYDPKIRRRIKRLRQGRRLAGVGEDQPSGGSLDAQDQVIPITPSDPTTKEPLTPTPVDVAKAAVAEAQDKAGGLPVIPLVIGAGLLIYILGRR